MGHRRALLALGFVVAALSLAAPTTVSAQDIACDRGDLEVVGVEFVGNHAFTDAQLAHRSRDDAIVVVSPRDQDRYATLPRHARGQARPDPPPVFLQPARIHRDESRRTHRHRPKGCRARRLRHSGGRPHHRQGSHDHGARLGSAERTHRPRSADQGRRAVRQDCPGGGAGHDSAASQEQRISGGGPLSQLRVRLRDARGLGEARRGNGSACPHWRREHHRDAARRSERADLEVAGPQDARVRAGRPVPRA